MAKQQRGLGRGLGALLGDDDLDFSPVRKPVQYVNSTPALVRNAKGGEILSLEISKIEPNPYQPRVSFDREAMEELAASIKSLGMIQPITVRRISDERYQIISGERRYRAATMAGLDTVPAYIRNADDTGMLEMAIVENVQRADLDPIEVAMSYQRLMEECHLTQEKLASRIGKGRVSVANYLRLLKLPAKVQYDLKVGNVSVGHAKVLLSLEDSRLQEKLCDEIIRDGLSVRALEQRIKDLETASDPHQNTERKHSDALLSDERIIRASSWLGSFFDKKVSVKAGPDGKGSMTIHFKSLRQVEDFCRMLEEHNL